MNYKFLLISLLLISSSSFATNLADDEKAISNRPVVINKSLSEKSSPVNFDAISELKKTLSKSQVDDADLTLSDNEIESFNEAVDDTFSVISLEEYDDLNIKPLYSDSLVKRYPDGVLVEEKLFDSGIRMFHLLNQNVITFFDLDSDSPTDTIFMVGCSVDKITDDKSCYLKGYNFIYGKYSAQKSIIVFQDMNLYRPSFIRIDKNKAFKSNKFGFSRPTLDQILKQMTLGKYAYIRFYKGYGDSPQDFEISLKGFSTAYNTLNILYSKIK